MTKLSTPGYVVPFWPKGRWRAWWATAGRSPETPAQTKNCFQLASGVYAHSGIYVWLCFQSLVYRQAHFVGVWCKAVAFKR